MMPLGNGGDPEEGAAEPVPEDQQHGPEGPVAGGVRRQMPAQQVDDQGEALRKLGGGGGAGHERIMNESAPEVKEKSLSL